MLQWARTQGCMWGPWTYRLAARFGHIEILDHLRDHGCELPQDDGGNSILGWAAGGGRIDALKWVLVYDWEWHNTDTCATAAGNGHLEALKWLRSKGAPWEKARCKKAATRKGHHGTAQWIAAQTIVLAEDTAP